MATGDRTVVDLDGIRSDGWFEQLGEELSEFDELCNVVGKRFVAFSFIVGARISSIAYDPQAPHTSRVQFALGDGGDSEETTLAVFRERLGEALLEDDDEKPLPTSPDPDAVRSYLGRRLLLLGPIFGIGLESLAYGGDDDATLTLNLGHAREEIAVDALREILKNAVRTELARAKPSAPFAIDFKKIPEAETANREGDYDRTIALLGSWPGPLSMFLRTPQGQALGSEERGKLVRALGALGEAYMHKHQIDWAEDVLRLGIQFGQELSDSGSLFGLLGQARLEMGRYGEAIGLIRRALTLGGERRVLLTQLARCFAERDRNVAALACIDDALAEGADPDSLQPLKQRVETSLGPALTRYRELRTGSGG